MAFHVCYLVVCNYSLKADARVEAANRKMEQATGDLHKKER